MVRWDGRGGVEYTKAPAPAWKAGAGAGWCSRVQDQATTMLSSSSMRRFCMMKSRRSRLLSPM